jgi:hypothetical protein
MMKTLFRGDTWTPTITVTQDDAAYDCTDYTVKMHVKATQSESADDVLVLVASWSDRSGGEGYFTLTHEESEELSIRTYYYQIKIYTSADNALVRSWDIEKLKILEPLEKDIT